MALCIPPRVVEQGHGFSRPLPSRPSHIRGVAVAVDVDRDVDRLATALRTDAQLAIRTTSKGHDGFGTVFQTAFGEADAFGVS